MNSQDYYDFLRGHGCCIICILRYISARGDGSEYENVVESLSKLGINHIEEKSLSEIKKIKRNTCPACLGLFSDEFLEDIIDKISNNPELQCYHCDKIVVAISFPMLYHIRQFSFWLSLIDKFPSRISKDKPPDVPLKDVAKLIFNPKLCRKLNKSYDVNGIMINMIFNHEDEKSEIQKMLENYENQLLKNENRKNHKHIEITRALLERNLTPSKISFKDFEKVFCLPPTIPSSNLFLQSITFSGPTVFVAGRYQKFCRELPHSPWIIEGKRIMEDSIQEIIIRVVSKYFEVPNDKIIFSSSGREDVDVRCIGNGRPFVLEIPNSKHVILPKNIAAEMEYEIDKSNKISVRHLQIVKREELVHIKTGEEKKKKIYRALCILKKPATVELMKKLNIESPFEIQQITPIRVLHRRSLHARPKIIHSVKATVCPTNYNLVILDITTQAGTYVKELIHGEFGRTSPSISSIINEEIDIMALDVIGIDLDWPQQIDNHIKSE